MIAAGAAGTVATAAVNGRATARVRSPHTPTMATLTRRVTLAYSAPSAVETAARRRIPWLSGFYAGELHMAHGEALHSVGRTGRRVRAASGLTAGCTNWRPGRTQTALGIIWGGADGKSVECGGWADILQSRPVSRGKYLRDCFCLRLSAWDSASHLRDPPALTHAFLASIAVQQILLTGIHTAMRFSFPWWSSPPPPPPPPPNPVLAWLWSLLLDTPPPPQPPPPKPALAWPWSAHVRIRTPPPSSPPPHAPLPEPLDIWPLVVLLLCAVASVLFLFGKMKRATHPGRYSSPSRCIPVPELHRSWSLCLFLLCAPRTCCLASQARALACEWAPDGRPHRHRHTRRKFSIRLSSWSGPLHVGVQRRCVRR